MSNRFWSERVQQLQPYVPGEQPKLANLIKLNTNELPFGPSPKALEAMRAALDDSLRLYPAPNGDELVAAVADFYQLQPDQVFVGNGSDEVLAHLFQALLKHDRPLLFPDITYSFYPVYCKLYDIDYQQIPLDDELAIELDDYARPNGGIIFPNPNAPTGRLQSLEAIEGLLQNNRDSVVVVDEAYVDFGGESAAALVPKYDNLVVVQTLSKSRGLAGLRVGLALGQAPLLEALRRVKDSFNSYPLGRVELAGAAAAFADREYFTACCDAVIAERKVVAGSLQGMGFNVLPSAANFVFAAVPAHCCAVDIAAELRQRGIIVRHFKHPRIDNFLRITIGTAEQNRALIAALKEILV